MNWNNIIFWGVTIIAIIVYIVVLTFVWTSPEGNGFKIAMSVVSGLLIMAGASVMLAPSPQES